MSQHDTLKSSAGKPADSHGAAPSGDHEVDLLLSEIDQRLAKGGPSDAGSTRSGDAGPSDRKSVV